MNEFENQSGAMGGSDAEELRGEPQVLRMLMTVVLLMLIGLSVCADYFLSHQTAGMQQATAQAQITVNAFPMAAANDFVAKLRDYSKIHPDYAPIAAKYPGLFGQPQQPAAAAPKK
jgi:hypothetical protein